MKPRAQIPEHIGPYRVTGRLGRGGMGEVFSGYDDRLDRPVALKRILGDSHDPQKALERFRREARAAARLSHPAIVRIYDWVDCEDQHWLVMELVEGRTLDRLLAEGPLPSRRAMAIARQVASGLAAAHEVGLVHRDLKSSNVIVARPGSSSGVRQEDRIKILDFGLAKTVDTDGVSTTTLTEEGKMVGTVTAMSPEQALGKPVDHRSDLFSLGTLLYEMLSGESPFRGTSSAETLVRICTAKERSLDQISPGVPPGLAHLVGRLLEKDPARRPADAGWVVAELDRLIADAAASTTASGPEPEPGAIGVDDQPDPSQVSTLFETPAVVVERQTEETGSAQNPPTPPRPPVASPSNPAAARRARWRRWSRWGRGLAVTGLVLGLGLSGLWLARSWWLAGDDQRPEAAVAETAPPPAEQLSTYELCQRGMALLERYDRKGNIDHAISDFQRALERDQSSAPALAGLAWAYWRDEYFGSRDAQRLQQALAAARRAVDADPYLAIARVSLGVADLGVGRLDDAERQLEHALQLEPSNADAHYGLAILYDSQGKLAQAEKQIHQAITARPEGWYYYAWLGALYQKTGRYRDAQAAFETCLQLTPDNFLAFRNLGAVFYMRGNLTGAAAQFQKALQIQPDATVYTNLGTVQFAQGLYSQSVSAFERAIETGGGSNNYFLWGNLGDAYRWTPDGKAKARDAYLRAIQLLRKKLDTAPHDPTLRTRLALYLAKRGDCSDALAEIAALSDLPDGEAAAWYRLAVADEVCDRRDAALAALESALRAGYSVTEIEADPELLKLRQDVRYHRLVMRLEPGGGS